MAAACRLWLAFGPLLCFPALPEPCDSRAIIVNPSETGRRELARVVREALHGAPVTLADDALTTSNMLVIDHTEPRDGSGRPLDGRRLSRPQSFELFTRKSRCVLVQTRTGRRWTLRHTECLAIQTIPSP
jgi:hypothetical protein